VNPSQLRPERLPDGHKPPTASDLLEAWEPQQESPVLDHYQGVKESGNPCLSKPRSEHESHFRWKGSRTP
jgi:hypothetical protein